MRFDIHLRTKVQNQVAQVAERMKAWEDEPRVTEDEKRHILDNLVFFDHTTRRPGLTIAGVDGSGDFPALSYADSLVYVSVAQSTVYASNVVNGLHELGPPAEPLVQMAWIPEEEVARHDALDQAFADLAGLPLHTVVEQSDYRSLKDGAARRRHNVDELIANLIRPHAADTGNVGLQLRSTGELGALHRLMEEATGLDYVLSDGTLTLPLVSQRMSSLFYEHLKRLCCVRARQRGIGYFALSKSHGLPAIETVEDLTREKAGLERGHSAEHWYLRLPLARVDHWELGLTQGRQLPPVGAVTYLVRFHHNVPVMRLDMDAEYWLSHVQDADPDETRARERRIFQDLDYTSHDQRCYGYPYPLKASHDRASLTHAERVALRKQIMEAAVKAGMRRALFRDSSQATGHR